MAVDSKADTVLCVPAVRESYITIKRGNRPLSDGLRHDAEMVARVRESFADGEMSFARVEQMLRHIEQRLLYRAREAEAIEDAAACRMGGV